MIEWLAGGAAVLSGGAALGYAGLRAKNIDRWLWPYIRSWRQRRDPTPGEPLHLILAICDHFEPKRGNVGMDQALRRVREWQDKYPVLFGGFRDADGRPPQHTFFYPEDEYEPELVQGVADLCGQGFGEVEIHLHHDGDTSDGLRRKLVDFKNRLRQDHGLLGTDRKTGETVYGFIHGNWALDNSRRDGRWCGVNNELDVLRETGCYADFTFPSAPDATQPPMINQLYWAVEDGRPRSHHRGSQLGSVEKPSNALMIVNGPLLFDWKSRKFGFLPGIENGNLQENQPPTQKRLALWMRANVKVRATPEWVFVKLHTHGVHEPNQNVLLGQAMVDFHRCLAERAERESGFRVHYVTAREMANLALAACNRANTLVSSAREYRYDAPPNRRRD